jgi:hypothetical protein
MSTSNPDPNLEAPQAPPKAKNQIWVFQHSQLFYWWPVWAVGFVLFLMSWIEGGRMAVVPANTVIQRTSKDEYHLNVSGAPPTRASGEELKEPSDHMLITEAQAPFGLHMSAKPYLGIIFAVTLLLVIVITNVPLRGLWSVVTIVLIALLIVIITLIPGAWEEIARWVILLDVHINAAGYLFIALTLFAMWAVTVWWFDRQIYIVFTPGLMKVRETIGGGETAYDTSGMTIEHLRDDFFRHWILGLGSGDLVVHPAGPQSREIRLYNVLFVTSRLRDIENMKRTGVVVTD